MLEKTEITISYDPDVPGQLMVKSLNGNVWNTLGITIEAVVLLMCSESQRWSNQKDIRDMDDLFDYVSNYIAKGLQANSESKVMMTRQQDVN